MTVLTSGCAATAPAPEWDRATLTRPVMAQRDGSLAFDPARVFRMGFAAQHANPDVRVGLDTWLAAPTRHGTAQLLIDGVPSFTAREAVVASAQKRVYVQQLFWPRGLRTARMLALLADRVEHGVVVRLIVDDLATPQADRAALEEFNRWVRQRYRALSGRFPRLLRELETTDAAVRFSSPWTGELTNDVIWSAHGRLTRRSVRVPAIGLANVLHFGHGKLIVADGHEAVTGGVNHADAYSARGRRPGEPGPLPRGVASRLADVIPGSWEDIAAHYGQLLDRPDVPPALAYRDTDIRMSGDVARDLEASFIRQWDMSLHRYPTGLGSWLTELALPPAPLLPAGAAVEVAPTRAAPPTFTGVALRRVDYVPRLAEPYGLRQMAWLFGSVRRNVTCHMPYLFLGELQMRWIGRAARRGVRVKLLTNGPDSHDIHRAVAWAARAGYHELQRRAGKNLVIYEWVQAPIHSKVCVADDIVSLVGSSNHDMVSQLFSAELGVVATDEALSRHVAQMMTGDLQASRPITRDEGRAWATLLDHPPNFGAWDSVPRLFARLIDQLAMPYLRGHAKMRREFLSL